MTSVTACDVPEGSLLAKFGGPGDYRDCFVREVPGEVSLEQCIERFYYSMAFRPERMILGLIGWAKGWDASADAIRALARGEANRFAAWELIERKPDEILLLSKDTKTASWLSVSSSSVAVGQTTTSSSSVAVGQTKTHTKLLFGSWVGGIEQSGWRAMLAAHVRYSRVLLSAV